MDLAACRTFIVHAANGGSEPTLPIFCDAAKVSFWAGEPSNDIAGQGSPDAQGGGLLTSTSSRSWVVCEMEPAPPTLYFRRQKTI